MTHAPDDLHLAYDDNTAVSGTLALRITLGRASFKAEGEASGVLGAFASFQEFYAAQALSVQEDAREETPVRAETTLDSGEKQQDRGPIGRGTDSVPLSVFLSRKKLPRGNSIIALGIAVWARRYKGEEVFTADSMKAFWRDSKKKVPSNIPRDLGSAATEGWLERLATGTGNYALTSYGEAHFDALPEADD